MTETPRSRVAVLASGAGSNLQAILNACAPTAEPRLPAEVVGVWSDNAASGALTKARAAGVPIVEHVARAAHESRRQWDAHLADHVLEASPDWVVLAGFMRILSSEFLDRFPGRVLNLHPALPGEFPGLHAIERALTEAKAGFRTSTGVVVHLVPNEGVDDGPVLATATLPILPSDDLASLSTRMHAAEHELLVATLFQLLQEAHR